MSKSFPVSGLKALDFYLSALPQKMQKAAYRSALTAAAAPIRDEARLRAPKETGKMAKSIKTGSPRQNPDGTFSISIRTDPKNNDHAFLGLFHEYGVAPHLISVSDEDKPVRGTRHGPRKVGIGTINKMVQRGSLRIGDHFVGPVVMHPGHGAQPFMRPALDAKADEAVKAFAERIRAYFEGKTGLAVPMDETA